MIESDHEKPLVIETYRGVVYPHELDHMGHMNVQWYTANFDQACWHLFSALGITPSYIRQQHKGMAALEQTTRYLAEVRAGDLLYIESRVLEISNKTLRFLHSMRSAETDLEVATSELITVHLDRKLRKACPLPELVHQRCEALFSAKKA